jgi:hypothetical protein
MRIHDLDLSAIRSAAIAHGLSAKCRGADGPDKPGWENLVIANALINYMDAVKEEARRASLTNTWQVFRELANKDE